MSETLGKARKRELAQHYSQRARLQGIYAVRCTASGEVWVSSSRNLDRQQNSIWFGLKTGGHPNRQAQAAWTAHGEAAFTYEIVETLEMGEHTAMGFTDLLKARERHWREAWGAFALVG